jgi:phenylacetate-CoA ligase
MKSDDLYLKSPVWLQSLLTAGFGWLIRYRRFGPGYREALEHLNNSQFLSADELRKLQQERLSAITRHAFCHVPHYRDYAKAHGLTPADVTLDTLGQAMPILEKDEVRADPKRFVSEVNVWRRLKINTSGTTGSPLTVVCTPRALRVNYAFFARFLGWHGVTPWSRSATFAGRVLVSQEQRFPPFWRGNPALRDIQFSSYHLSPRNMPHYLRRLEEWVPELIDTYPSSGVAVAAYLIQSGWSGRIRPKVVVTSSETLFNHQREAMEDAFACPVRDQYGSAEMVAFASECEHGTLHVSPEYGVLEVVPVTGTAPGIGGEIVATGFINPDMPLIRYRIGDQAILSDRACPCGRHFPVLATITGRTDDIILTPEGTRVGRLGPVFKGAEGVLECQIVQESLHSVIVRAVVRPGHGLESLTPVLKQLHRRLPRSMTVSAELVSSIPRSRNGKLRAVVSMVQAPDSGVDPASWTPQD